MNGQIIINIVNGELQISTIGNVLDPVGILERAKIGLILTPQQPKSSLAKPNVLETQAINKKKLK